MLSIGATERETGVSAATLRKWELRYGFPMPHRTACGHRLYSDGQVRQITEIVRRLAGGERIGKILGATPTADRPPAAATGGATGIEKALRLVQGCDVSPLRRQIELKFKRDGLRQTVEGLIAPLTVAVGEGWASGRISTFSEHLYSDTVQDLLHQASRRYQGQAAPAVLLAVPPGELHTLGISMVSAVLAEAAIPNLMLRSSLPVAEISRSLRQFPIRALGVSASASYPPKVLLDVLKELRRSLPRNVQLWVGGGGTRRLASLPSCRTFGNFDELIAVASALSSTRR